MIGIGAVFPALGVIVVGLRFWARRLQKVQLLADDWYVTWEACKERLLKQCASG